MKLFRIECRTGCTCCKEDNHYRGFYETREEAQARIDRFYRGLDYPLASQYARYGSYGIEGVDVEQLPDGRIIVNNERVYAPDTIVSVSFEDGSVLRGNEITTSIGY
jgi:hypothetical protein